MRRRIDVTLVGQDQVNPAARDDDHVGETVSEGRPRHTIRPKSAPPKNLILSTSRPVIIHTVTTTVAMSTAELASSYAALILADDGVDITVCTVTLIVTNQKNS